MTAEIAIMNKSAVALAADSAVTFMVNGEPKVFQTVNKLFALSKYQPVGLMVYGSAEFMDVDWETIVKIYRSELGEQAFDTLREHAYHFLKFLHERVDVFDESSQTTFVERTIGGAFSSIRERLLEYVNQKIAESGTLDASELRERLREIVTERRDVLREHEDLKLVDGTTLDSNRIQEIRDEHTSTIGRAKKLVFENLPMDGGISRKLNEIALYVLTKEGVFSRGSGVVVAGYGRRQIFPSLEEFHVDGVFSNMLRFRQQRSSAVGRERTASVIPFAQSEMVVAFMEGVDPDYQSHINEAVRATLDRYSSTVLDLLVPRSSKNRERYMREMSKANEELAQSFESDMNGYRRHRFVQPVVRIVEELPKSELAAMAESLVNLTSFRRHVTPDAETVGGPIDVAVISRGDGFVWIKRKHYFQPELNQHFFANYYREVRNGERKAEESRAVSVSAGGKESVPPGAAEVSER